MTETDLQTAAPDRPWHVYGTCPECKGVVAAVEIVQDDTFGHQRKAIAERIRAQGFLAFQVNQAKVFTVGHGVNRGCKRNHDAPAL